MNIDLLMDYLLILMGLGCLLAGIFLLKKDRFMNTDDFSVFREMTPLPAIVNFWILKIGTIIGSLFLLRICVYLLLRDLK